MDELKNIKKRYERRSITNMNDRYSYLNSYVRATHREKEDVIINLLKKTILSEINISDIRVLEIGCGNGNNIQDFIKWGISPQNIVGNELLQERIIISRAKLPQLVRIIEGDASNINNDDQYDLVYQSTVFTSILNNELKRDIADKMWSLVKPGGYILWYDFTYNNPKNQDVKGIPLTEIYSLFPNGKVIVKRVTLAPPLGRFILNKLKSKVLYNLFNLFPFFKTHVICLIEKNKGEYHG